jgi:hypothetical protein
MKQKDPTTDLHTGIHGLRVGDPVSFNGGGWVVTRVTSTNFMLKRTWRGRLRDWWARARRWLRKVWR